MKNGWGLLFGGLLIGFFVGVWSSNYQNKSAKEWASVASANSRKVASVSAQLKQSDAQYDYWLRAYLDLVGQPTPTPRVIYQTQTRYVEDSTTAEELKKTKQQLNEAKQPVQYNSYGSPTTLYGSDGSTCNTYGGNTLYCNH